MTKHFECTACGKCCYGQLPLTCKDAFANAKRFPLCFVWTPIQQGSRDFKIAAELGTVLKTAGRKELAVLIMPTSFIPNSFACPALSKDMLCSIHRDKPTRCKTMPFYPYREERYQADLLNPRQDWKCDTSEDAPIVYQDHKIVFRGEFDREKQDLIEQVPAIRRYAEYMLKYTPSLPAQLVLASTKSSGGHVVTSLSSFLTATKNPDATRIAQLQLEVLKDYITKTAEDPTLVDFHRYYVGWAKEMSYLSQRQQI